MKKICCLLLACMMALTVFVASAEASGDWLNGLSGLFGNTEQEQKDEFPDLSKPFSGETISVVVAGKTVKVHKELVEAMEAYEAFFDEYVEVMTGGNMLQYAEMLIKYSSAMEALDKLDEKKLSNGDLAYYLDVMTRVNQKLLLVIE